MAAVAGFGREDAFAISSGMGGRGAVELIIANVALKAGLFSLPASPPAVVANLFSAVVIMALVTTAATPIALRLCLTKGQVGSRQNIASDDQV